MNTKHTVQITYEAFNALVGCALAVQCQETELAYYERFNVEGVNAFTIFNHVSSTVEYYVQDINV